MKYYILPALGLGATLCAECAAAVANPGGILEAADVAAIQTAIDASGTDGLVLGNGMLKWTGIGETTWNDTFTTAPVSNLEVTVNVTNPGATLKIAGTAVGSDYAVFLKSGPGTLEFNGGGTVGTAAGNYPWAYGWWVTYAGATSATFQPGVTAWDAETGRASGGGYSIMTVVDGTLRFNAPGKSFNIPTQPWVGSRLQNSPRLEITNNTSVTSGGGVFCMARGTGTSANGAAPSLSITDGGSLTVAQLSMGYGNGQADFYPRSRVELDGGTLNVNNGSIEQSQNDTGRPVVFATNGSYVACNYRNFLQYGWLMRGAAETWITGSSTGATRQVAHNPNTRMEVTGGSVFKLDRIVPQWYNAVDADGATAARVHFDGATLTRYSDVIGEWFGNRGRGYTNFVVGANGITLETDGPVWFGASARAGGDGAGAIVKTGGDTLFMRPTTNLPVAVSNGALGLTMSNPLRTNDTAMAVTLAPGANLIVGGEGALGGSKVAVPDGSSVTFLGNAVPDNLEWKCNNFARRLFDGTLQMTLGDTDSWGSAWHSNRVSVTESFAVTFDSFTRCGANANAVEPYYGWMLVLQNKDLLRIGGGADKYGYAGGTAGTSFTDSGVGSFAVGLNVLRCNFLVGRNGEAPTAVAIDAGAAVTKMDLAASVERPCRCTFAYDADAHTATLSVFIPSLKRIVRHTESVDLEALLGADAYIGFTASTHSNRNSEHCFRNFRVASAASKPDVLHTGGTIDVSATRTLDATLSGNDAIGTFAADVLKGNGAVTLNITDAGMFPEEAVSVPVPISSTDESQWVFSGNGHMTAEGPACSTGPSLPGGFISANAYPVTGSWKLSYDWKSGLAAGKAPADVLWFSLDNHGSPYNSWGSDGITLDIRCYVQFSLRLTVKGVAQAIGDGGATRADLYKDANGDSWFDLRYKGDLHVELEHDASARTLTLTLSQQNGAVSKTFTIENFDAATVFNGNATAKVRGYQTVGGAYAEAIYANMSFTGETLDAVTAAAKSALASRTARGALAFGATEGVTSVDTAGTGLLAFLEPGAWNVPVTVHGAGLKFSQPAVEDITVGAGGGWVFNMPSGGYSPNGGVKIGTNVANNRDNAHYRHRVRVSGDWRASWTMKNVNSRSADGISFFLHNDPRGENAVGGANGCGGFANCFAIGWYTYQNAAPENKWGLCRKQNGIYWQDVVSPVVIRSGDPIDVTLVHDASSKTVSMSMVQGANRYSTVIEDVDVKDCVGGDYAWLGFGSAGGGYHTLPVFDNFRFEQTDVDSDPLATTAYLPSVSIETNADVVLDTAVSGRTFRVAETLSVADGKTLRAFVADKAATLAAGTLALGSGSVLSGHGGVAFAPDALAGDLSTLAVDNATLVLSTADVASGRLADTTLSLANGAKVRLSRNLVLAKVVVDGELLPQGMYNASNCAWIVGSGSVCTVRATMILFR